MKYGIVYLNGHLHSGIKHLYARHSNGLLELELGDWKDKRRFNILFSKKIKIFVFRILKISYRNNRWWFIII